MRVRRASSSDFDAVRRIEAEAWPTEQAASESTLTQRLRSNPSGHFLLEAECGPVGFFFAIPMLAVPAQYPKWEFFARHALLPLPWSTTWCGVTLSVGPRAPRGSGTLLLRAAADTLRAEGAERLSYGARMPGFRGALDRGVDAETYLDGLRNGSISEPAVGAGLRAGATIEQLLREYYDDVASANCAALLTHRLRRFPNED